MDNMEAINFEYVIDNHLFYHYYQPIIDIQKLEKFGYEGLLRSNYTDNPEAMFATAIKINKLLDLDTSSIYMAIQYLENKLENSDLDTYFFLNVYPSTLISPTFLKLLEEVFATSFISREKIVLEINEAESIQDFPFLKETVYKLKTLGFHIALDDIGKGTSPFEKMLELEPRFIKLDKYFANDLYKSPNKQKMLKFLLAYCSESNVKVILEGIETDADLSVAKSLGVHYGQGFLLGRPDLLKNYLRNR